MRSDLLVQIQSLFNNAPNLVAVITKFMQENADVKKQLDAFVQERVKITKENLIKNAVEINGVTVISMRTQESPDIVKNIAFQLKGQFSDQRLLFVSGSDFDGKASIVVVLSDQLVKSGLNASNIIKSVVSEIEGSGGGQPFFATAGGKRISGINVAMDKVVDSIR